MKSKLTGSPGGPMVPGYPGVPEEPWGKYHTIDQTQKPIIWLKRYNISQSDRQMQTCSPFIPGRPGDPLSPCWPWGWQQRRQIRKSRKRCAQYLLEWILLWNQRKDKSIETKEETSHWNVTLFDSVLCFSLLWDNAMTKVNPYGSSLFKP